MDLPPAYFDTSVIAKHYVVERGMQLARTLLVRHRVVSSRVAVIELRALLRRRAAGNEVSESECARALARLVEDRALWELVDTDDPVLSRAEDLVVRHPIRTLDAIHVASALHVRDASGISLSFITADTRQRDAATAAGLDVVWVASD